MIQRSLRLTISDDNHINLKEIFKILDSFIYKYIYIFIYLFYFIILVSQLVIIALFYMDIEKTRILIILT